jgi:hypothetical protein
MRTVYKVTGSSSTKPTNLPEGLTVETTRAKTEKTIQTSMSRQITVKDNGGQGEAHLRVKNTASSYSQSSEIAASLTREEATQIRDALNEILEGGLRKVIDSSGFASVWFEVEKDKFHNYDDREAAQRSAARGNTGKTLTFIENNYGVQSITFE